MTNIPDEYLNSDYDFGFTMVDEDELEGVTTTSVDNTDIVVNEVSSEVSEAISSKLEEVEGKVNAVLVKLEDMAEGSDGDDFDPSTIDVGRIEEKLDKILAMENAELASAVTEQSEGIRAIIDEVEERKNLLTYQYKVKIKEVEKLVMPLLYNLTQKPEKEYLLWPDRAEKVQGQINKILEVTRADV
jgi:hypothetical protein